MTRDALKSAMLDSLRMNRSVVVLMIAYIAFALILGRLAGFHTALQIYSEKSTAVIVVTFLIVLIAAIVLQLYRYRPAGPIRFSWHLITKELRVIERAIIAFPCILLFPVFASAFTSVKVAIGFLHPFRLDPLLARLDSTLHGGHAWELIHPVVAFPIITFFLNVSYNLWIVMLWMTFALVAVMTSNRELREQYLVSFVGCWVLLGTLAAIGLSSVGPCFYGLFYPTDPYAPLMSYLRSANETYPVWSLSTQELLWEQHVSNSAGLGSGISAMPSLHLAMATLNALLLSRLSRIAGILGWLYLVLILVGSVHLGWHYAIDGYVSIFAVLLIWRAAGWWAARGGRLARPALPSPLIPAKA